ncbi:MAG: CDP-diacylglycerol--glycerol-3-phosphate 3-phosphatidyltransferase, partial [Actinomycetota bacterium]|nr:CDP-diacylglycerol--glycerol-3-phosphate 3-phosphatidyltransferase [Actinomycetota bacterium]
ALVSLVELGSLPAWVALVIISREFIVTGLRMVAVAEGQVIAAGSFGKFKTVMQIIAIVMFIVKDSSPLLLLGRSLAEAFGVLSWAVMIGALVATVYSMIDYFHHARDVIELAEPESETPSGSGE